MMLFFYDYVIIRLIYDLEAPISLYSLDKENRERIAGRER